VMGSLIDKSGTIKIDSLLLGEYAIAFAYVLNNAVEENENEISVTVYPNPSKGVLNIPMSKFGDVQVKIYNVFGKCIYQHIYTSSNQQIDLSSQPNGIYFVQIKTGQGLAVKKIIIQK
jgi:hypothetical protein